MGKIRRAVNSGDEFANRRDGEIGQTGDVEYGISVCDEVEVVAGVGGQHDFLRPGKYAGNTQLFLTPGVGFGRMHGAGRFRFSSAVGMQIAATRFHTYDHRLMISTRFSF